MPYAEISAQAGHSGREHRAEPGPLPGEAASYPAIAALINAEARNAGAREGMQT